MCAGRMSGQLGGAINYSIFSLWLFLAFVGFAIAMSSLSALQHYENKTGISDGVLSASFLVSHELHIIMQASKSFA